VIGAGALAALISTLCAAGCAVDPSVGSPSGEQVATEDSALVSGVTQTVGGTSAQLGACMPLTCCFPSGAEWGSNPFEDGLRALGCSTPAAYTERYGSDGWWMYTRCHPSVQLTTLVAKYSTVAPYQSTFAANVCLLAVSLVGASPSDVFVQFDPTCTSCRSATTK
jgi:hypothetical protein